MLRLEKFCVFVLQGGVCLIGAKKSPGAGLGSDAPGYCTKTSTSKNENTADGECLISEFAQ